MRDLLLIDRETVKQHIARNGIRAASCAGIEDQQWQVLYPAVMALAGPMLKRIWREQEGEGGDVIIEHGQLTLLLNELSDLISVTDPTENRILLELFKTCVAARARGFHLMLIADRISTK